jgi:hypothetical protein
MASAPSQYHYSLFQPALNESGGRRQEFRRSRLTINSRMDDVEEEDENSTDWDANSSMLVSSAQLTSTTASRNGSIRRNKSALRQSSKARRIRPLPIPSVPPLPLPVAPPAPAFRLS